MAQMPPLRFSSRLAFMFMFNFPTLSILGFAGGILAMFMSRDANARGPAVGFAAA
jgi:hypothetical protein